MVILVSASVMVVRQYLYNEEQHVRMREDFILLHERGFTKKAEWYYQRLVQQLDGLSDHALIEDYHRTIHLVDPDQQQLESLIWKYHWAVRNKLESRVQTRLKDLLMTQEQP